MSNSSSPEFPVLPEGDPRLFILDARNQVEEQHLKQWLEHSGQLTGASGTLTLPINEDRRVPDLDELARLFPSRSHTMRQLRLTSA